ncbi:MAG: biotin--[acetyl-CoA-carboxylase] ligase [Coprobacter sp.]|nr:biotin--[acetyl-CoA-carboxylase] ligase [Coprobacter sp.]
MMIRLKETESTNTYLKQLLSRQAVEEWTVVVTDSQTAGRGQRGNNWEAEPGKNLTFSLVLYPRHIPPSRQFCLSQMIALGVTDALQKFGSGFSVKWPNDIYWNDQKIAGILIENEIIGSTFESAVAGIGLNVNQEIFRSPAPNPVSLKQITGIEIDLSALLTDIVECIRKRYYEGNTEALHRNYLQMLFRKEGMYPYRDRNGLFYASLSGIGEEGHLILETENHEIRKYAFKEISYILK